MAEKCDTKAWHISLAEQNWINWPPPERILFWQNRIEFWQKEMVGPPSKMPQERLWFEVQDEKKRITSPGRGRVGGRDTKKYYT